MSRVGIWGVTSFVILLAAFARGKPGQPDKKASEIDWKQVDQALGKSGALQPDGAYKVGLPRGDLHVTVGDVAVKPALALGSWAAFKQVGDTEAILMGDLVLLETEVARSSASYRTGASSRLRSTTTYCTSPRA